MNYKDLASKYKTPLYVYDFDYIKKQFLNLQKSFKGAKSLMTYAVKANSNLSLLQLISSMSGGADCVSINEVKRAIKAGISPYKIILSGVGKRDDEIQEAIKLKILFINIESLEEIKRVENIAKNLKTQARISVRVNPNIDPKTHSYISTGLHENKFGVDVQEAYKIYFIAKQSEYLDPIGIHFHIGSQLTDLKPIIEATQIVADMVRKLSKANINLSFFDVGGGIGIKYENETLIDVNIYAKEIRDKIKDLDITIITEMGRSIVGDSGVLLTKVLYEKQNQEKRFVIVDSAMNDLIRPSLYNAYHEIKLIDSDNKNETLADIVGPICESGDFLGKDILISPSKNNDLLIIKNTGAYGFSLSSNYNSRGRCAEVALQNGKDRLIRDRENFDDLISKELKYLQPTLGDINAK